MSRARSGIFMFSMAPAGHLAEPQAGLRAAVAHFSRVLIAFWSANLPDRTKTPCWTTKAPPHHCRGIPLRRIRRFWAAMRNGALGAP